MITSARVWSLDLPPNEVVSLNHRTHWAKRNRQMGQWRDDTTMLARAAHIPRLERVAVSLDYWPPDRRRRDRDNVVPVLKACCDGLVRAGVIEDDDPEHLSASLPVIHKPREDRKVVWVLTVTECAA